MFDDLLWKEVLHTISSQDELFTIEYILIAPFALGLLGATFKIFRSRNFHCVASLVSIPIILGPATFAATAPIIAVFALCLLLERASLKGKLTPDSKWRDALIAAATLYILILATRYVNTHSKFFFKFFMLGGLFLMLRLVNYLWEFGSGQIKQTNLTDYILWMGSPFGFFGPLTRYSNYHKELTRMEEKGGPNIFTLELLGGFLMAIAQMLCWICLSISSEIVNEMAPNGSRWIYFQILIIYPWATYLTLSWRFSWTESCAQLLGINLTKSFNQPIFRRNLGEFWANWHMSVTGLFRDYLFLNRWGFKRANLYINAFVVFIANGFWHGGQVRWLFWGLLHAAGFSIYLLAKKIRPQGYLFGDRWWGWLIAIFLTQAYWICANHLAIILGNLLAKHPPATKFDTLL